MPDHTQRICPQCHTPGLIARDDPDQEGWESTTVWDCPNPGCGYHAESDFALEMDESSDDDDDDYWDEDE